MHDPSKTPNSTRLARLLRQARLETGMQDPSRTSNSTRPFSVLLMLTVALTSAAAGAAAARGWGRPAEHVTPARVTVPAHDASASNLAGLSTRAFADPSVSAAAQVFEGKANDLDEPPATF